MREQFHVKVVDATRYNQPEGFVLPCFVIDEESAIDGCFQRSIGGGFVHAECDANLLGGNRHFVSRSSPLNP